MNSEIQLKVDDALIPPKKDIKESQYILTYRLRTHHSPLFKYFKFAGPLEQAIARGRSHCERMDYIFQRVSPLWADFEIEEKRRMGQA